MRWNYLSLGGKLATGGAAFLIVSLVLGSLSHDLAGDARYWVLVLNWTFFYIGAGCVGVGLARLFSVDR
jgi:hypothetical protein